MKRRSTIIITVIVAYALLAGVVWSYRALRDSSYRFISSQRAPNGNLTLFEFRSESDAGHAPYGEYLVLSSEEHLTNPMAGYIVFAGYCNPGLEFSWLSDAAVRVQCNTTEPHPVRTLASKAGGVDVQWVLGQGPADERVRRGSAEKVRSPNADPDADGR